MRSTISDSRHAAVRLEQDNLSREKLAARMMAREREQTTRNTLFVQCFRPLLENLEDVAAQEGKAQERFRMLRRISWTAPGSPQVSQCHSH
mmetsp:Transcript_33666/g.45294  ORF Transcript_33666/g.45294 Transcript_33666/m.45294 type:complete len:91 (-) Transcript_33666:340-612(-)|eukprot:scaffold88696_cov29-Tisochrysis_lutea.AAC.2